MESARGTISKTCYKILDSHVGLIYGDSITLERAYEICERLKQKGFASINIVFGIGSFTYQYVTRDTDGYAIKNTYSEVAGKPVEVYKKPRTDKGDKTSAKVLLAVYKDKNGEHYLKESATFDEVKNCEFVRIFADGVNYVTFSLQDVRDNINELDASKEG